MVASPILGGFSVQRSGRLDDSEIINLMPSYVEGRGEQKSPGALYLPPGLVLKATVGSGPIRGLHQSQSVEYIVSGTEVFGMNAAGILHDFGSIGGRSPVSIVDNGTQVGIFDGQAGYVIENQAMSQMPLPAPFSDTRIAPTMGVVIDGFCVAIYAGQNLLVQSNVRDMSTWSDPATGLAYFAQAQAQPDYNMALASLNDQLYVLKQFNTEIWANQNQAGFTFQPIPSAVIEWGCVAPWSVAKAGNSLMWLARNQQGKGQVLQTTAYTPQIISTVALMEEIDTYPNVGDAIGYAYQLGNRITYVLTFPEADRTWAYDMTMSSMLGSPVWYRWEMWDGQEWHRHWGNAFSGGAGLGSPT